jgi:AraC-like DNA-binding protein
VLDFLRHFFNILRQNSLTIWQKRMRSFPQNPMTDGMAWSGFDKAAAGVAGGVDAVFRAIGVSPTVVERPGMRVPFHQYVAYFEAMARLSGDLDFGHRFGLRSRADRSGIPGHLILNARRFRDGLRDLARTLPTLAEGLSIELVEDRNPPALIWSIAPNVGDAAQFMRFVPAYLMRMAQAHRGAQWRPKQILATLPPPRHPKLHASQFGCTLVFHAQINAIEIEPRDLYAVKRGVDRHVHALLATYAEYLLTKAPPSNSVCDAVASAIRDGLAQGQHDFDFVARRLGVSRRTLQRRIAASATSFSLIRDHVRFELATCMLADSGLSIGEIACRLGYSEIASFSHAFVKRSGQTPRQARSRGVHRTALSGHRSPPP